MLHVYPKEHVVDVHNDEAEESKLPPLPDSTTLMRAVQSLLADPTLPELLSTFLSLTVRELANGSLSSALSTAIQQCTERFPQFAEQPLLKLIPTLCAHVKQLEQQSGVNVNSLLLPWLSQLHQNALQFLPLLSMMAIPAYESFKQRCEAQQKKNSGADEPAVHTGIRCDECQTFPITGVRFKCTSCNNYDLCSSCEQKQIHPAHHILLKLKQPTRVPVSFDEPFTVPLMHHVCPRPVALPHPLPLNERPPQSSAAEPECVKKVSAVNLHPVQPHGGAFSPAVHSFPRPVFPTADVPLIAANREHKTAEPETVAQHTPAFKITAPVVSSDSDSDSSDSEQQSLLEHPYFPGYTPVPVYTAESHPHAADHKSARKLGKKTLKNEKKASRAVEKFMKSHPNIAHLSVDEINELRLLEREMSKVNKKIHKLDRVLVQLDRATSTAQKYKKKAEQLSEKLSVLKMEDSTNNEEKKREQAVADNAITSDPLKIFNLSYPSPVIPTQVSSSSDESFPASTDASNVFTTGAGEHPAPPFQPFPSFQSMHHAMHPRPHLEFPGFPFGAGPHPSFGSPPFQHRMPWPPGPPHQPPHPAMAAGPPFFNSPLPPFHFANNSSIARDNAQNNSNAHATPFDDVEPVTASSSRSDNGSSSVPPPFQPLPLFLNAPIVSNVNSASDMKVPEIKPVNSSRADPVPDLLTSSPVQPHAQQQTSLPFVFGGKQQSAQPVVPPAPAVANATPLFNSHLVAAAIPVAAPPSISTFVRPSSYETAVLLYSKQLTQLRAMGFTSTDYMMCDLLTQFKGEVQPVINALLWLEQK